MAGAYLMWVIRFGLCQIKLSQKHWLTLFLYTPYLTNDICILDNFFFLLARNASFFSFQIKQQRTQGRFLPHKGVELMVNRKAQF